MEDKKTGLIEIEKKKKKQMFQRVSTEVWKLVS